VGSTYFGKKGSKLAKNMCFMGKIGILKILELK
jgi:hypothetical protein